MKNKTFMILAAMSMVMMASCIDDEPAGKECDIESAWVEDDFAGHFMDVTDMRKENISSTETEITFTVRSLISLPQIPVKFKITPGATIEPASGSLQDFSTPVIYTVTSEDGQWQRKYVVQFKEPELPVFSLGFENVEVRDYFNNNTYHYFFEYDAGGMRRDVWDSGNLGALMLMKDAKPEDLPTYSTPDGRTGKALCLNTQSTGEFGVSFGKPIAAGNLFWGKFVTEKVIFEPLKSTQFGVVFDKEPVRVIGYYKYKPGPVFTNKDNKEVPGRTDEAGVYAVFYRNKDANGNPYFLYGDDVETDEKLKANPQVYKIARVASLPPTDTWKPFEMFFEGKDADDQLVVQQGFNLALVFSSSKGGAQFEGAVGSTLYVDDVVISCEK